MNDQVTFKLVNHWFNQLIDSPIDQQQTTVNQLFIDDELSQEQADLLLKMLAADKAQNIPDRVVDLEHDWLQEDTNTQLTELPNIGSYRLLKLIGSGGMGHVYLAERNDGSYIQKVAIKISQFHLNKNLVKRFENERQILAQLTHPHIAQLLDGGTAENDQPYLVMELVNGVSIDQYCINKQLGLKDRLSLIIQTCEAVSYAHQKLILHRDLKPANILVNDNGQVKLLDFGIAKLLADDIDKQQQTMTQMMTRHYASPEQIKGQLVSTQSDLFSLAIVTYELVSGYHPFSSNSEVERDQNVISGKVKRITSRNNVPKAIYPELTTIGADKLKGDLENILNKALAPDVSERYVSVEAFEQDLKNFIANRPIQARKPSWLYSMKKLLQRNKVLAVTVVVLSSCLLIATVFSLNKANDAELQRLLAVKERNQSELIADFLTDVFTSAKPLSDKQELSARDLLIQGFANIKTELSEAPEQRFELIAVMFDSLESLSYFDTVFEYMDQLYPDCVRVLSAQNVNCQSLLITAAEARIGVQQDQQALALLKKAEANARIVPVNQSQLAEVLRIQFNAYINLQLFDEAVSSTHEALNYYQNINHSPVEVINIYSDLAVLATHQDRFEAAASYYELMELNMSHADDSSLEIQNRFYANYSFFFAKQKLYDQAIIQRQKAVELMQVAYDRPSFSLAWEQESLAKLYFFSGDLLTGIDVAKQALDTFGLLSNETGKHIYELKLFIAEMLFLSGQHEDAAAVLNGLEKNTWDKRCVYELVQAMQTVYQQNAAMNVDSINQYDGCIAEVSYPTKFYAELKLLLHAEYNYRQGNSLIAQDFLNQLDDFWQINPDEALPLKTKAKALSNKIIN